MRLAELFKVGVLGLLTMASAISGGTLMAAPMVVTTEGKVTGLKLNNLEVFRGVPYAQPPTGTLRWQPPQPLTLRSHTLNAEAFGPRCMQRTYGDNPPRMSEDCLTLNVWSPGTQGSARPVMVYIHGGGF